MGEEITEKLRRVKHFTQIDPANEERNDQNLVNLVARGGTDAIIFAGTDNVNERNLEETVRKFKEVQLLKVVAPSCPEMVPIELCKRLLFSEPPFVDGILPYVVYNSKDVKYITQLEKRWIEEWNSIGECLPLEKIRELPYIIISKTSTVGKKVPTDTDVSAETVACYAAIAMMRSSQCFYIGDRKVCSPPWLYLETTGYDKASTGMEAVDYVRTCRQVANRLGFKDLYLISGGEIRTAAEARMRIEAGADAINVGNPLYSENRLEGYRVYLSTIRGVKPYISRRQHEKLLQIIKP